MLASVMRYGALKAKISALKAKMLTQADYEAMYRMGDVAQIVRYLKTNTAYGEVLSNVRETDMHRSDLEAALNTYIFNVYKKLYVFMKDESRGFFRYVFLQYEIEVLKRILRALETKDGGFDITKINRFFIGHSDVPFTQLFEAKNISEFIASLKGTQYYKLLSPFLTNTEHANIFSVEMTLDMYYFKTVTKLMQKDLRPSDRKIVKISFGSEVDMLNLIWIYRCKKYFDTPEEIIFTYLLPYHYHLREAAVKALVKASDAEEFVRIATEKTPYGKLFENLNERFIEENYSSAANEMGKSLVRKYPYSIAALTEYTHSLELKKENLITLTEGVRYHMDPEEIRKHLRF